VINIKIPISKHATVPLPPRFQVNINIYACVEFGCVVIGENNNVYVPGSVQVGCEINMQIPIINTTRHRLHYCIVMRDQRSKSETNTENGSERLGSSCFEYDRLEEMTEYEHGSSPDKLRNDRNGVDSRDTSTSSTTVPDDNSLLTSVESARSAPVSELNTWSFDERKSGPNQLPSVFKFERLAGELGPNEKRRLTLSFCPFKDTPFTVNAKCYLKCDEFPEVVSILPVVVTGNGCKTSFKVRTKSRDLSLTNIIVTTLIVEAGH